MFEIIKVLNNNTLLVSKNEEELIVMSKGIGFGQKTGNKVDIPRNAKQYRMQKSYQTGEKTSYSIDNIDPVYIEIANEIIELTKEKFGKVEHDILLPLADHIYFAIKRIQENDSPANPFYTDIQLIFPDEYEVALKGKNVIYQYTGVKINADEIGFITLHVHSAISVNKVSQSMEVMRVIREFFKVLQKDLRIHIDSNSLSYIRLMNHIKFLLLRLNNEEELQMDITSFTKEKFPFAYNQAKILCNDLAKVLHKDLPDSELGYLALHLERILSSTISD
ncbi:PRD domain-containing protein [Firmicutes bacterium AM41-11]|nr:PRD domain-containing protein [Firmicutes bacterium AM41-11]